MKIIVVRERQLIEGSDFMKLITQGKIVFHSHYERGQHKYISSRGLFQLTNEAGGIHSAPI